MCVKRSRVRSRSFLTEYSEDVRLLLRGEVTISNISIGYMRMCKHAYPKDHDKSCTCTHTHMSGPTSLQHPASLPH